MLRWNCDSKKSPFESGVIHDSPWDDSVDFLWRFRMCPSLHRPMQLSRRASLINRRSTEDSLWPWSLSQFVMGRCSESKIVRVSSGATRRPLALGFVEIGSVRELAALSDCRSATAWRSKLRTGRTWIRWFLFWPQSAIRRCDFTQLNHHKIDQKSWYLYIYAICIYYYILGISTIMLIDFEYIYKLLNSCYVGWCWLGVSTIVNQWFGVEETLGTPNRSRDPQ